MFPDPASREYDFSDARYIYKVTRDISKDDLVSLYPEKEEEIEGIANGKLGYEIGGEDKHIQKRDYGTRGSSSGGYDDEKGCVDLVERYYKKLVPHVFIGDLRRARSSRRRAQRKRTLSSLTTRGASNRPEWHLSKRP